MAIKQPPTDDAERDLASAQLGGLALRYDDLPWSVWKDAVLDWHLQRFATARSEAWIPGFAGGHHDPAIHKLLSRFHRHHMHAAIQRLRAENVALRRKLIDAAGCARFYAAGENDDGGRAGALLHSLLSSAAPAPSARVTRMQVESRSRASSMRYGDTREQVHRIG